MVSAHSKATAVLLGEEGAADSGGDRGVDHVCVGEGLGEQVSVSFAGLKGLLEVDDGLGEVVSQLLVEVAEVRFSNNLSLKILYCIL